MEVSLNYIRQFLVDVQLIQQLNIGDNISSKMKSCHLKLEITLAIPASKANEYN